MNDEAKSREQLISELAVLRQILEDLDTTKVGAVATPDSPSDAQEPFPPVAEDQTDLICRWSPDGTLTYVNKSYCLHLGQPPDNLIGARFFSFVPQEHQESLRAHLDHLIATVTPAHPVASYENPFGSGGDHQRWMRWINRAIFDEDGQLQEFQSVGHDITAQKQAEQALRQSEEMYRALVNASPDIVTVSDLEGHITHVSSKALEDFGIRLDQLVGTSVLDWLAPEDRGRGLANILRALSGESHTAARYRVVTPAGTSFMGEINTSVLKDTDGNPTALISVIRDVSHRVQIEEEMRRQQLELETILDSVQAHIFYKDMDHRLLYANKAFVEARGLKAEELIGHSPQEYSVDLPESVWKQYVQDQDEVISTGKPKTGIIEQYPSTDGLRWMETTKVPYRDADGKTIGVIGFSLDITEQVRMEAALRESQERLNIALKGADLGLWDWNVETGDLVFNQQWAHMLGYDLNEIEPHLRSWERMTHPDDRQPTLDAANAYLQGRTDHYEIEFRMQHKSGEWRWILARGRTYERGDQGRPLRMAGTHLDITERKQAEDEKEQLQIQFLHSQKMEALGRLTAGVAHDFNNLLTVINGYAQILQQQLPQDDPSWEPVDRISQAGWRAADLIEQLMIFSRKHQTQSKLVNLNTVVTGVDRMLRRIIGEDIKMTTLLDQDLWLVEIDPAQIEQVIVNLAVNARDAMPASHGGGQLTIKTRNVVLDENFAHTHLGVQPGKYVFLEVADSGLGMDEGVKSRVFEPFFTTKDTGKGTGLGLATVFGIIKQAEGHIWVESQKGEGSTFTVCLPQTLKEGQTGPAAQGLPDMPTGDETIILLEDDDAVRDLTASILRGQGYTIHETSSGREALDLCLQCPDPVHLLVTDVIVPDLGGIQVAKQARQVCPQMKILFISGYGEGEVLPRDILDSGANFLQKPFSPEALTNKVRLVLDS